MASKSGSSQAALLAAINYLGLIDENGNTTPILEELTLARGTKREELLKMVLLKSYSQIFNSSINLEKATTEELYEIFQKEGVIGEDTLRKCVTFFCLAAKASSIKLSSYIKPYAGKRRLSKNIAEHQAGAKLIQISPHESVVVKGESEWDRLLQKFPEFDTSWSAEQVDIWLKAFRELKEMCRE